MALLKSIVCALSALVFITGCLVITGIGLFVWAWLVIQVAKASILAGWLALIGSVFFAAYYNDAVQAPWKAWFQVWQWTDAEIDRRLN